VESLTFSPIYSGKILGGVPPEEAAFIHKLSPETKKIMHLLSAPPILPGILVAPPGEGKRYKLPFGFPKPQSFPSLCSLRNSVAILLFIFSAVPEAAT